jgi:hypothetical protein
MNEAPRSTRGANLDMNPPKAPSLYSFPPNQSLENSSGINAQPLSQRGPPKSTRGGDFNQPNDMSPTNQSRRPSYMGGMPGINPNKPQSVYPDKPKGPASRAPSVNQQ